MKILISNLFILLFLTFNIYSQSDSTTLIFDEPYNAELPRNFRMSNGTFKYSSDLLPDTTGLRGLNISGSSEFNNLNLPVMLKTIGFEKITVIDLRQETHGFVNGMPISWYGKYDWADVDLAREEVIKLERKKLDSIDLLKNVTVTLVLQKNKADDTFTRVKDSTFEVHTVQTEEELTEANKTGYYRITATDHRQPTTGDVDRFTNLVMKQKLNVWFHFHCHAGDGRTTTFMVMYDMMKNAKIVEFNDIILRQHLLGGIDLRKDDDFPSWDKQYAIERTAFLKDFYNYCKTNADNFETYYSNWLKK